MKNIKNCLHIVFVLLASALLFCGALEALCSARERCCASFSREPSAQVAPIAVSLSVGICDSSAEADEPFEIVEDFNLTLPEELRGRDLSETALGLGLDGIFGEVLSLVSGKNSEIASFFLSLLGITLLMSLSELLLEGAADIAKKAAITVGALAVFYLVYPVISTLFSSLGELNDFFGAVIPTLTALISVGGGTLGAGAQSLGMGFTLWLFGGIGTSALSVICSGMLAAGIAFNISDGFGDFLKGLNGAFTKIIGILTALIAGVLSLQSFVTSAADGAALRAARYAASNLIPVVGGVVSGAMSTLSGGLSYAVGAVGGGAVAAILSIALSPLVTLLLFRLCFFICGALTELVGAVASAKFISGFSKSFDSMISVYALSVVIYIFEIILFLKSGVVLL